MNPVDKHLAEQAEKYGDSATHSGLAKPGVAFLAGAQAAKEIYLLQGKLEAYRVLKKLRLVSHTEAKLAKLLSEKGEG